MSDHSADSVSNTKLICQIMQSLVTHKNITSCMYLCEIKGCFWQAWVDLALLVTVNIEGRLFAVVISIDQQKINFFLGCCVSREPLMITLKATIFDVPKEEWTIFSSTCKVHVRAWRTLKFILRCI